MALLDVLQYPTVVDLVHESVYRSYQILDWIEDLLERGVPGDVVLDILRELRALPRKEQ